MWSMHVDDVLVSRVATFINGENYRNKANLNLKSFHSESHTINLC